MEFIESKNSSCIVKIKDSILISEDDIKEILCNQFLHDIHAHFIIEKEGEYNDARLFNYGMAVDKIKILDDAYTKGRTILVKDLEHWSEAVMKMAQKIPSSISTNAHLYLSPKKGSGFGWHQDDRDVYVMMQFGSKKFEIKNKYGDVLTYILKAGDVLYIPYGHRHRAMVQDNSSAHISFGVWVSGMYIKSSYQTIDIPLVNF